MSRGIPKTEKLGDLTQDFVGMPLPTSLINYDGRVGSGPDSEGEFVPVLMLPGAAERTLH